jgi:predicted HNH restriction endonuclease
MKNSIENLIAHVGADTFVKYYDFFVAHKGIRKNKVILDEFVKRGDNFIPKTADSKATNWKRIFQEKREIEALEYISRSDNRNSYSEYAKKEALLILGRLNRNIDYPDEISKQTAKNIFEGAKISIIVNAYERDTKARERCKETQGVTCCICGFDFEKVYGQLGEGFIHVHHLTPLSEIGEEYIVNPTEHLRPVCPNCHAMLHRKGLLKPDELQDKINPQYKSLISQL